MEQWKGETVKRYKSDTDIHACDKESTPGISIFRFPDLSRFFRPTISPYHLITLSRIPRTTLSRFFLIIFVLLVTPRLASAKRIANIFPLPQSYSNEASIQKDLQQLSKENPETVKLHIIGKTAQENRTIYALQIQTDISRIPVLIVGQHHGDEVIGVEIAMLLAKQLCYSQAPEINQLLDKYSFWIIPTLNPEGYNIVTSGKHEWKRKNNTDTNKNGKLDVKTDGVDLNRNYPTFWNLDKPLPESHLYYKGKAPASEKEVKAIIELASIHRFKYAFFYHSSVSGNLSEKIFLPWQNKRNKAISKDFKSMRELTEFYAANVPKDYKTGTYSVHAGNTSRLGNARNHFYYEYGTFAFDIEVCGKSIFGVGIVHPDAATKDKIVRKNMQAIIKTLLHTNTINRKHTP